MHHLISRGQNPAKVTKMKFILKGKTMQEKIAEVTTGSSYVAASGTVLAGLTINEWGVIVGIILGIATYVTSLIYKHKHYQLAKKVGTDSPLGER
jgi:hypothetical protein